MTCSAEMTDPRLWSEIVVKRPVEDHHGGETPGGAKGTRTPDPLLAKQVLFQLSYSPKCSDLPKFRSLFRTRSVFAAQFGPHFSPQSC
jgi:hypothetical protein